MRGWRLARSKKKVRWAPGREGGTFLTGGGTALATCSGEGCLQTLLLALPPEPEPEQPVCRRERGHCLGGRGQA